MNKKYYLLLLLMLGAAFVYIFLQDPCNSLVRSDFSAKYPDYKIVDSTAQNGSPDSVHCYVFYQKPDSKDIFKDIWLYANSSQGWSFSKVIAEGQPEQAP
jgi:hypothetical protein